MIRSKGEAGSGNIVEAVRHMRAIRTGIAELAAVPEEELVARARDIGASYELVRDVARSKRLPVVLFCAGGISTPADAALMMSLGAEGLFVGSGIFKSEDPAAFARAIVNATTHWNDAAAVVAAQDAITGSAAMAGLDLRQIPEEQLLSNRGN